MRLTVRQAKLALFLSGLFFGGAIDHAILAVMRSDLTPYGSHVGVAGNWGFAALDVGLAATLYWAHRRRERRAGDEGRRDLA